MGSSFKERKPPTDEEIRTYFQVLREDPRSRVFAPLAESLIRRGRLDEAEKICRLGLEANPDFSDGHLALSRTLFYRFRHEEALEEVKLALGLDRHNLEAYLIAAEIFLARSQAKAAIEACMKALDLDPHNQEAQRLIQRLQGGEPPASAGASAPNPVAFRTLAPTGPSQRPSSGSRPPSDPFAELMVEVEADASKLLGADDQPFTALSSGSQLNRLEAGALRPGGAPPAGVGEPEPESEPTLKAGPPPALARPARSPTPALPPHPTGAAPAPARSPTKPRGAGTARSPTPLLPLPAGPAPIAPVSAPVVSPVGAPLDLGLDPAALFDHIPEHTPIPSHRPLTEPPLAAAATAAGLSRVDAAQAVIDRYGPAIGEAGDFLEPPLRVPRSGRWWILLILVLGVGGATALVYVAGVSARRTDAPAPGALGAGAPGPAEAVPDAGLAAPALPVATAEEEAAADAGPAIESSADADPADAGSASEPAPDAADAGPVADEARPDTGPAAAKKPVKKPVKRPVRKPPRKQPPKAPKKEGAR